MKAVSQGNPLGQCSASSALKRFDVAVGRVSFPIVVMPQAWRGGEGEEGRHTRAWEHKYGLKRVLWHCKFRIQSFTQGTELAANSSHAIDTSGVAPAARGCKQHPLLLCYRKDGVKSTYNTVFFCIPIKQMIKEHQVGMNLLLLQQPAPTLRLQEQKSGCDGGSSI